MMFHVERNLTAAVRTIGRRGCGETGTSAQMCDLDIRREEDAAASCADRGAEIHVFEIHRVPLVQQSDGLGVAASHEQAGAADPVGKVFMPCQRVDVALCDSFLPKFGERPDHLSKRQLCTSRGVKS